MPSVRNLVRAWWVKGLADAFQRLAAAADCDSSHEAFRHTIAQMAPPESVLERRIYQGFLLELLIHRPVMASIVLECCSSVAGGEHLGNREVHDVGQRICEYLDVHFRDSLTLQRIARELGFSRTTLCTSFARHYGTSIHQYLIHKKLVLAAELLVQTDGKVAGIGRECGFENSETFHRAFRRKFGMTPTDFRRASQTSA